MSHGEADGECLPTEAARSVRPGGVVGHGGDGKRDSLIAAALRGEIAFSELKLSVKSLIEEVFFTIYS